MSDAVSRQSGFSLPETLLALIILIVTVTALAGYQRGLANGFMQLNQYRQLWRDAWRFSQLSPAVIPADRQMSRMQTSQQRCVSITVTITMPADRRAQMTRLHCPVSQ
ncbi:prepilin-type N-terminal cleavage/methylation domain-containing protein [Klebsiella oxytoca]|uniref:Prepilin-type N-terminal cleavage/methylation domain-containing protein n=1 Tax=Klebsiella oxytoca TaxID=571 RepID=A0A6B8MZE9_KLEOX|nr:prepilin-type N-terminal cleavage/methylation domain-containing protein [Klebsiella oxytoca]QGN39524.1 prepilin-type N-terminal cleavage/methylation domain-containing protein [Klebsiella oxytoca]